MTNRVSAHGARRGITGVTAPALLLALNIVSLGAEISDATLQHVADRHKSILAKTDAGRRMR
jgi:hypothetical protein